INREDTIFQYDNDPKHTSQLATNDLKTIILVFCNDKDSPQTSNVSNISGNYSRNCLQPIKIYNRGYFSYRTKL
ncbi:hypothetical protein BDR04DRAFT_1198473, partial [Suillus decipiens]